MSLQISVGMTVENIPHFDTEPVRGTVVSVRPSAFDPAESHVEILAADGIIYRHWASDIRQVREERRATDARK